LTLGLVTTCSVLFWMEESRRRSQFRDSVEDLGRTYVNGIQRQVMCVVSSTRALEAMIKEDDKNFTTDRFEVIGHTLIEAYGGITSMQLAPFGTVRHVHPLEPPGLNPPGVDSSQELGHALMLDPSSSESSVSTIRGMSTTVISLRVPSGEAALLACHPIFSRYAPEFLPAETWTAPDGTVHANGCAATEAHRANCSFPGPETADGASTHFWGFALTYALVPDLLEPVRLERLEQGHHRMGGVSQFAYALESIDPMAGVHGIIAHSTGALEGPGLRDPIRVPVEVPEFSLHFVLLLAPQNGWPTTSESFLVQTTLVLPLVILSGLFLGFTLLKKMRRTYVRHQQLENYRSRKQEQTVSAAVSGLDRLHFPMCLMAFEEFERLGALVRHEAARDSGKLRFEDETGTMQRLRDLDGVVFVSHQWVGFEEPDPEGTQYTAMVDAIRRLRAQGARCKWVWVDYCCIPQKNKTLQQNAIDSLTVYAAYSSIFLTVAPSCKHAELGVVLDLDSYNSRGWCRLEQLSYLAATVTHEEPAAFVCTEDGLGLLWQKDSKGQASDESDALAVMEATFTCCSRGHPGGCPCDKTKIVKVMLGIYWRLLAWQRDLPEAPARLRDVLRRWGSDVDRYFPAYAALATERGDASKLVEVFGELVPVMRDMFEAECCLPRSERIQVRPPSASAAPAFRQACCGRVDTV